MGKRPNGPPRKKSPAPSVSRSAAAPNVTTQIVGEIYTALERLDADEELLAIVGRWRDTLNDTEVLSMLQDYNASRPILHRPQ